MSLRAAAIIGLAFLLSGAALVFSAGAVAAEGALHPARQKVAEICPCIAHTSCGDASVTAPDGTRLNAWFYRPEHPNGAGILLLHGLGSSRSDMVALGYFFLKAGYSVLEPDLRGHGTSGGYTTFGVLEAQDVPRWADWLLRQQGVTRLYGFGASLGGSVLLEALRRESRFRGVIAESSFSDFAGIAHERWRRQLPFGLKWLTGSLVQSGFWWVRLRYSVDLTQASAVEAVRATKVPVYLIHGGADGKTLPDNSRRIARANPAGTSLWIVPGAGHADIRAQSRNEFEPRVLGWLTAR